MAASISSSIIACLMSFNELIERITYIQKRNVEGLVVGAWEDELGRLRMWAANIGAHQTGQSSLDFRLRDASHIRDQIIKLLQGLVRRLQEARDVLADDEDSDEEEIVDVSLDEEDPKTEIQELQESLATNINCLFQMSMLVRKPAQHDVYLGSKRSEVAPFEPFDYNHVREKYPDADDALVKRLGNAITRRRQYLKYRERHAAKLKQGISNVDPGGRDFSNVHEGGTISLDTKSILSDTIATDFQNPNIEFEDNVSDTGFSQTSYAPTLLSGGNVAIPPPPKTSLGGVPFECPYCFYVITVKGIRSWNKHVFRDLQPYVCTALTCTTPTKLYSTRHEWLHHSEVFHPAATTDDGAPKYSRVFATCPLCREEVESGRQLDRHLARHLQELALFILPCGEEDSDGSENRDAESSSNAESVDLAASSDGWKTPEDLPNEPVLALHENLDVLHANHEVEEDEDGWVFQDPGTFTDLETLDGEDFNERMINSKKEVDESQRLLVPDHQSTLNAVRDLARVYYDEGRLARAEELYEQALEGYKRTLGPDHETTLSTAFHLGYVYSKQVKLAEAVKMYKQVLMGYEKTLGPNDDLTISTARNLGYLYKQQGQLEEAEALYHQALNGSIKRSGPNDESTLSKANELASLYRQRGKMDEATHLYKWALQGSKMTYGPGHKKTISLAVILASLCRKQGRLTEAEVFYRQALDGGEIIQGRGAKSTLSITDRLVSLYRRQGKLVEAEELYLQTLSIFEKAYGSHRSHHPDTIYTVDNLVGFYREQGQLAKAESLSQRFRKERDKASDREKDPPKLASKGEEIDHGH